MYMATKIRLRIKSVSSYYNSSSVCLFVCLCVCFLSPPRSFDGSSPNLVGVCRWTSHLPLRGSFSKRSTGRRVNGSLSLSTILYMCQPHATQLQKAPFALLLLHLITLKGTFCCTASRRVVGVCRWTSELPLRVFFSKRSTGHFFGHYIIYDSRRHHADQSETTPLQKVHGVFCLLDG